MAATGTAAAPSGGFVDWTSARATVRVQEGITVRTGATFAAAQGGATQHERRAMKTGTMFACQAAVAGNGKGAALAATKRRHFRRQAGARIMLVIAQNKADMARLCGQCGAPIGLALRVAEHINHRRVHHE